MGLRLGLHTTSDWGDGRHIGVEVARDGDERQVADPVVGVIDQLADRVLHPFVARLDRLLGLLTGLPDAEGGRLGLGRLGDGEGDKTGQLAIERQELGLGFAQEVGHLPEFRGDVGDVGKLHSGLISIPARPSSRAPSSGRARTVARTLGV